MKDIRSVSVERLFRAIRTLKTDDEFYAFFKDICTVNEILDMAQRLDTAILLSEGKNYTEICEAVSVSTATISRVSRCLNYGEGGYQKVIENLKNETADIAPTQENA